MVTVKRSCNSPSSCLVELLPRAIGEAHSKTEPSAPAAAAAPAGRAIGSVASSLRRTCGRRPIHHDLLRPARVAAGKPDRCGREHPSIQHLVHGRAREAGSGCRVRGSVGLCPGSPVGVRAGQGGSGEARSRVEALDMEIAALETEQRRAEAAARCEATARRDAERARGRGAVGKAGRRRGKPAERLSSACPGASSCTSPTWPTSIRRGTWTATTRRRAGTSMRPSTPPSRTTGVSAGFAMCCWTRRPRPASAASARSSTGYPGGRRGRTAVDVVGHREPGGDVDVRGVDLEGGQLVEGDRGFTRPSLGLEDDSVGGRHVGCPVGVHWWSDSRGHARDRDIVQPPGGGPGPVKHIVPGTGVAAMVLVRGHFGQRPAKPGQSLEVRAGARAGRSVGDAVVGVPGRCRWRTR